LAQRIRSVMIEGKFALPLDPFLPGFRYLPSHLDLFGKRLGTLMTHVAGKQGQKHKTTANQLLIMASELVRLKTGEPTMNTWLNYFRRLVQTPNPGLIRTSLETQLRRKEST